jgi:hypothetical protein
MMGWQKRIHIKVVVAALHVGITSVDKSAHRTSPNKLHASTSNDMSVFSIAPIFSFPFLDVILHLLNNYINTFSAVFEDLSP